MPQIGVDERLDYITPSIGSVARRVARPSTSSTGHVSSTTVASIAASSAGKIGTRYSLANRAAVGCQLMILTTPALQKMTLHRVRHTYEPSRPFKAWLAAIARRCSIDLLRHHGRLASREVSDSRAYETFADPKANRTMEVFTATDGLSKAISGLSQQQREAVELLKLRELSLPEASKAGGRSITALKVNVHRAMKSLRRRLKENETVGRHAQSDQPSGRRCKAGKTVA